MAFHKKLNCTRSPTVQALWRTLSVGIAELVVNIQTRRYCAYSTDLLNRSISSRSDAACDVLPVKTSHHCRQRISRGNSLARWPMVMLNSHSIKVKLIELHHSRQEAISRRKGGGEENTATITRSVENIARARISKRLEGFHIIHSTIQFNSSNPRGEPL